MQPFVYGAPQRLNLQIALPQYTTYNIQVQRHTRPTRPPSLERLFIQRPIDDGVMISCCVAVRSVLALLLK